MQLNTTPEFLQYALSKLLLDVRSNDFPVEEVLKCYVSFNMEPQFRKMINLSDKDWILRMLRDFEKLEYKRFAISASRKIKEDSDVRQALIGIWNVSTDYEIKRLLGFHLLDYLDISDDLREQINSFVAENPEKWLEARSDYSLDTNQESFEKNRSRLKEFPITKHFIYLYFALLANNKDDAREFLQSHLNSKDFLAQKVASDLLSRLAKESS